MKNLLLTTLTATALLTTTMNANDLCEKKVQTAIEELKTFKQQNDQKNGLLYKDATKLKNYIIRLKNLNDKVNSLKSTCK